MCETVPSISVIRRHEVQLQIHEMELGDQKNRDLIAGFIAMKLFHLKITSLSRLDNEDTA